MIDMHIKFTNTQAQKHTDTRTNKRNKHFRMHQTLLCMEGNQVDKL